MITLTMKYHRK